MIRLITLVAAFAVVFTSLSASTRQIDLKDLMQRDLGYIRHLFTVQYGPQDWKKEFSGWEIADVVEVAQDKIAKIDSPRVKDYQQILRDVLVSAKDYHVGVRFHSTEKASLPFQIKGFGSKYFVAWIDRTKLPTSSSHLEIGDQVLSFGGKDVHSLVMKLKKVFGDSVETTDKALGEILLTRRSGAIAMDVPKGPVEMVISKVINKETGEQKEFTYQYVWEYTPEKINNDGLNNQSSLEFQISAFSNQQKSLIFKPQMMGAPYLSLQGFESELEKNPFGMGLKKSYIPYLGKKVWESNDTSLLHAYIYELGDQRIGYIRIPSYSGGEPQIEEFGEVIKKFEAETTALVIDQINNPGGSLFYLYGLVSHLIDKPAFAPKHRVALTQQSLVENLQALKELKAIKDDESAKSVVGETIDGYPVDFSLVQLYIQYLDFQMDQWKQGKALTDASYFVIDKVNPSMKSNYTKPILVMVNELDFSGGDFFPAILQDNKRATIFGARTSGAGGYVKQVNYPNLLGVAGITITGSLAERIDKRPIENLGVVPDVKYQLSESDLTTGFKPYKNAINSAVRNLLK